MPNSDEGIAYSVVDSVTIQNLSDTNDKLKAKRRELHVSGKTYSHVSESAGQWVYRWDAK